MLFLKQENFTNNFHCKVRKRSNIAIIIPTNKLATMLNKIKRFLDSESIIPNHRFGFREKHGTGEQVDRVTGEIRKCFEQKKYCSAVFLK